MAVVTSDLLASTLVGVRSIFNESFPAALGSQAWLNLVLDKQAQDSSGHSSMDYGWLGSVPLMEKFRGSLELGDVMAHDYNLTNELYKGGFAVSRLAFERDQLGLIKPKTNQLAQEAALRPGRLLWDLLNAGSGTTLGSCYDAGALFQNSRTIGASGTIDNILVSAGTSVANCRTDIATARSTMMAYKDDQGRPQNIVPNVIVCHPTIGMTVYEALVTGPGAQDPGLASTVSAPSGSPVWSARNYTVIEDTNITDTGALYFFHVSPGLAPFIYQVEVPPTVESITDPMSESAVMREQFIYAMRGSFNVGYGEPRCAIITT